MKKNIGFIALCLILFTCLFFKFTLFVTVDGTGYYWYLSILNGLAPISRWSIVRGPSFPIILFSITNNL